MPRLEFRTSPAKNAGLLLLGFVMVAAGVLVTQIGEDSFIRGVGWFCVAFFSLGVIKAFLNLFSNDVVYVFDERGIDDQKSGMGLIPWSAITRMEVLSYRGTRFLVLSLDRPDDFLSRVSSTKRGLAGINKAIGWGDWSLAFVGLSPGVSEAESFISRYAGR